MYKTNIKCDRSLNEYAFILHKMGQANDECSVLRADIRLILYTVNTLEPQRFFAFRFKLVRR